MVYFISLAILYGLAAFLLYRNRRMQKGVVLMLASPLAAASALYVLAAFVPVPHWSFIVAQTCFLISIIIISIFERRDRR